MSSATEQPSAQRACTSITRILAASLALVITVPFVPLSWLTWREYRRDLARVEAEIDATNRQIAGLGVRYIDQFVLQIEQELERARMTAPSGLPVSPHAVRWESVDFAGKVVASTHPAHQAGTRCAYAEQLAPASQPSGSRLRALWIDGPPPTVAFAVPTAAGALVAVVDPEALHHELTVWSAPALDRHVYVVDGSGRPVFYSDLELSRRGLDLSTNPPVRLHAAGGQGPIRFNSAVSGKERLGFVWPATRADWGVIVTADVGSRILGVRARYVAMAWSILFAFAAAMAILLWTSRRLARPLVFIVQALRAHRAPLPGPLELPPCARGVEEYDALAAALDDLASRVRQTELELIYAEKMASLGHLATGIAHEIGTPLNVISGNAQYLLRKMDAGAPERAPLTLVIKQTERIAAMIRQLLDYARPIEARLAPIELGRVVEQALALLKGLATGVEVCVDIAADMPKVLGDPKLLEHVVTNLAVNALQAMPSGGRLSVVAGLESSEACGADGAGAWVCCLFADTGCGINPDEAPRIFEPFFSARRHGRGTGLGLAVVERIVRRHNGRIAFESRPGRGSVFMLRLRPAEEPRE